MIIYAIEDAVGYSIDEKGKIYPPFGREDLIKYFDGNRVGLYVRGDIKLFNISYLYDKAFR
jgi:hypothetical protein